MTSQGASGNVDNASEEAPLWNYVTKLEKSGAKGGTWKFKCNICNEDRQGSYSRIRVHLLGIKNQGIVICKKATRSQKADMQKLEDEFEKKKNESGSRALPLPCEKNETNPASKKRKSADSAIARSFGIEVRDQLDQEIARMFYSGGVSFNLARNPHYHRSYQFAAENKIDGYVPPSYNKLRTTLLQKERNNVERLLVPFKSTWKERGVAIVGPIFSKAVNCFGKVKDRFFISGQMKEVINEVGHQNVVQIITDYAANCKAAGEIIESTFPHIYWTPCVVHTLNLALKNICAAKNVEKNASTYEECNWITDLVKRGLEAMVISEEWSTYIEDDVGKATFVKGKILSDDWWEQVSYIIDYTRPIYEMLRFCDTDKPCLHLVYEMWDSMIEKVKSEIYKKEKRPVIEVSPFYTVVHEILVDRWAKNNTTLHCLAHSLNPRDLEVSSERMKCFRRLFPSIEDHLKVMDEYALFSMRTGPFEDLTCISMMFTMEPKKWWANFGAQTPFLQTLAFKLLGQLSSSSCYERNWSTYSFIHSLRRNKLNPSRAKDLVFIHNNLRFLSRNSKQYEEEKTKMWDVGGDDFDSMEDMRYLEFASLSLDERKLENGLMDD
ncbi:uncharacterized protein LOC111200150 [Brassica napus]|uniref:uncharacterized protein LOC111200150 n=1 Tax=Brassica napus TaxID=3708 RepID=UPI002078944F|nr:uncharacterized protein LOC111200150 [Brassica napus]